jgi:uncharacterized protein (DUF58 family)
MAPRRLTLTTRGALALVVAPVSAVVGAVLGAEELVLLALALATMVVGGFVQSAYRAARARTNWRVTLELSPSEAEVGGQIGVVVTLAAAGRGGSVPTWLEDPQQGWERVRRRSAPAGASRTRLPNPALAVRVPPLESGASAQFCFAAPTESRGVFTRSGHRLWCSDSFGVVAQLVAEGPSATITVHPIPAAVGVGEDLLRGEWSAQEHQFAAVSRPKRDSFGDFAGLRPYIPGDRLRLLYWPALARTGELVVRDFEDAGPHRVHVVADVRPVLGTAGAERVLAAVAGVGLQVLAQGSVLELSTTSGEQIAIGPGPLGELALLRALAGLDLAPAAPTARRGLRRRRGRGSSASGQRELHAVAGTPLVVTTTVGAAALPDALGFAHLVLAP